MVFEMELVLVAAVVCVFLKKKINMEMDELKTNLEKQRISIDKLQIALEKHHIRERAMKLDVEYLLVRLSQNNIESIRRSLNKRVDDLSSKMKTRFRRHD